MVYDYLIASENVSFSEDCMILGFSFFVSLFQYCLIYLHKHKYWVDAKVSADFFSFLWFKFLLKQNTINQQRIYHCYL